MDLENQTRVFKADLEKLSRDFKAELQNFITKADLQNFATKVDLQNFATKVDLERLKSDLERQIQTVKVDLIKWLFGFWITLLIAIILKGWL